MRVHAGRNTSKNFTPKPLTVLVLLALFSASAAYAAPAASEDEVAQTAKQKAAAPEKTIDTVTVEGQANPNAIGQDKVYSGNISTVFKDKQQLENFQGASPADIYKGMVGVFSGDARNSGALDTNIRGIQGQERVPVIVDGTKQAITVWRGYNGANNRNYIDPLLISNVRVEKGPSMSRDIQGSVGGSVVINTLTVDDIVKPGQKWGIDLYGAWANNTTRQRDYKIADYVGKDRNQFSKDLFPDIPSDYWMDKGKPWAMGDNLTWQEPRSKDGSLKLQDQTYRIAAAAKTDYVDFLAAYAYRNRGNYFAGKGGWRGYYSDIPFEERFGYNFTAYMSDLYKPENEVFNSSETTKSLLLKTTAKPTDKQSVQLGWRRTDSTFGDIMPSRVADNSVYGIYQKKGGKRLPQWPLSNVKSDAYNLEYTWQPDNRWIDLHANLWTTRTKSEFNSSGGWPIIPTNKLAQYGAALIDPVSSGICNSDGSECQNSAAYQELLRVYQEELQVFEAVGYDPSKYPQTIISNSTLYNRNNRWGLTLSNKMQLTDRLDLTIGTAYQYEKLSTDSGWVADPLQRALNRGLNFGNYAWPRSGIRTEWEGSLNFDWQATDQLDISAGMKYNRYTSEDTFLNERRAAHDRNFADYRYYSYDPKTGAQTFEADAWKPKPKARAHGFSPMISASYRFNNDYSRVYTRLAQQVRMPTLFETTIGFSAIVDAGKPVKPERGTLFEIGYVHDLRQWLPSARTADIKLAYYNNTIKDVIDRSDAGEIGFRNSRVMQITNFNKQKVSGLELQSRYDNGRFFADLSLGYILKNDVCDAHEAQWSSRAFRRDVPACVPNGFNAGYLQNMAPPKFTADLVLGSRFFNEKLEVGTRLHYHSKKINSDGFEKTFGTYTNKVPPGGTGHLSSVFLYNVPIDWKPVTTVDAYLSYKLKDTATFTLAGTNLTNRYYVDPLTRTLMPAPGRALRMSLNVKF